MVYKQKIILVGIGLALASINAAAVETADVEDVTVEVLDVSGALPEVVVRTIQLPQTASEKARGKAAEGLVRANESRAKSNAKPGVGINEDTSETVEKLRGLDRAQEARAQAAEHVSAAKDRAQQAKTDAQQQVQEQANVARERGKSGK